jgi:hypothetical protein
VIYKFKYKYRWFFKTHKIIGHSFNEKLDRMALHFPDGSLLELADWSCYDCKLGPDWALAVKKSMEEKAGQAIVVNRDLDAK